MNSNTNFLGTKNKSERFCGLTVEYLATGLNSVGDHLYHESVVTAKVSILSDAHLFSVEDSGDRRKDGNLSWIYSSPQTDTFKSPAMSPAVQTRFYDYSHKPFFHKEPAVLILNAYIHDIQWIATVAWLTVLILISRQTFKSLHRHAV